MSMSRYNQCTAYGLQIAGFKVPFGAIYGKDKDGYYVFSRTNYRPKKTELPLYRLKGENWVCSIEDNRTTQYINDTHYKHDAYIMRDSYRDGRVDLEIHRAKVTMKKEHTKRVQFNREAHFCATNAAPRKCPQKYIYRAQMGYALNPYIGVESNKIYDTDRQLIKYGKII